MPEQPDKAKLLAWLQTALELELATIPPYLVALLSIKLPGNREPAELIRSVMIEEMLHLALVANLINSLGARPRLNRHAIPHYPLRMRFEGGEFEDRQFPINLAPFSADAIETFMKIEQPLQRAPVRATLAVGIDVPALTIGEFYSSIVTLLEALEQGSRSTIFIGEAHRQIQQDYYWSGGGKIVAVHNLASAKEAMALVIAQGEGAWPQPDASAAGFGDAVRMGHYYRFKEIACKRRYQASDDPAGLPTGAPISVDYSAVYPIKMNARASDYPPGSRLSNLNTAFNIRYTAMLLELNEVMNGTPKTLYTAIMDSMHELTPTAHEMMKVVIDGDPQGYTGCPTFDWVEGYG